MSLLDWINKLAAVVHQGHSWRFQEVGDPSIGGSMVSRWMECTRCKKTLSTVEFLTHQYEDVCNK